MSDEDKAFWLSWCIEEYANMHKQNDIDVAKSFDEKGVLDYLDENAEILHTQGKIYIISSIDDFLNNAGL